MIEEIIIFIIGLICTLMCMPIVIHIMRIRGILGVDVHKKSKPYIPEMGGVTILIGLSASVTIALLLKPNQSPQLLSFLACSLCAGLIGAIDDVKPLSARLKTFLTLFAGIPILISKTYNPYGPTFPIIGQTRLTIVYPFLVPISIAITSNSVNMLDPFNGSMSGTCTIATISLLISSLIFSRNEALTLTICLIGPLIIFFYYNKYPSKIFSGDIGSLSIGAGLGAIALIGRLEMPAVVALAPQIMNAFYGLTTIGRLYERRQVSRPVTILDNGKLAATIDQDAPITLARVILARGSLYERQATLVLIILSLISGLLAIFTAYLTVITQ